MGVYQTQAERVGFKEQEAYWKITLRGDLPHFNFRDHFRPPIQSFLRKSQSTQLEPALFRRLEEFCAETGLSAPIVLLAAFKTLILRYTNQEDVIIGTLFSDCVRDKDPHGQGHFVNPVVLRTRLAADLKVKECLHQVRTIVDKAAAHRDYPFDRIVEITDANPDLSRLPIFQVMCMFPDMQLCDSALPVSPNHLEEAQEYISRCDLVNVISHAEGSLRIECDFDAELFEQMTIARLLGHFGNLLEGFLNDPEARVSTLTLLTEVERHQLLTEWNDTKRDYPRDRSLYQLFEEQAEGTPNAVAVVSREQQLTYRELNARANQLAHYLRKLGVGPDALVGFCMDRSLEMVVGLLGILKAGGAYLPLDPAYPEERLAFMLRDSQAPILMTQESVLKNFPKTDARIVSLDKDWKDIGEQSTENPASEATPENLAYVTYTSGSTGQPKGVEIPHRSIVRLLLQVDYVKFDSTQTFLHLAPLSFDASTFEIWGALLHGAKCVLLPRDVPSPTELGAILHKYKVTTLWLTASFFNAVIDDAPEALSGVRHLLIGGETLSVSHVQRALLRLPETQIINGYGPTESTTFTCCYSIPRQLQNSVNSIPIGRPIANTQVYLLDARGSPVPVGVAGELCIGGDGLARGYLNRPDLTAEKFIPDPFSGTPGARLYKTGDWARYLSDGNIEFLGRADHQVKVRGFRVELEEVEAVLGQHCGVRETVVMAREDRQAVSHHRTPTKHLAAYVVPNPQSAPTIGELRSFLKEKLPEYMIPAAFVFLDSLPLTPNGKVDRRALPTPDRARVEPEHTFVAPRSPVEKLLARIWSNVLAVDRVGIHDNFFDLGGHSLLATQVASRIHKTFHVEFPLRRIFEKPTIAQLAVIITAEHSRRMEPID